MLIPVARFLVRILPAALAFRVVLALSGRSQRPAVTPDQEAALARAGSARYGPGDTLAAWTWGEGPTVLLVHGWGGRAAQMAPLAEAIAAEGHRVVAIEVTGHGASPGERTSWADFIADAGSAAHAFGPLHAIVAHSAGGLATMAARASRGVSAGRHVCICAPSHPFPPINVLRKRLDPPEPVIERYRAFIANQFGTDWDTLRSGHAFIGAGADLLLIYDRADRFVGHDEGDTIHGWCRGSRLLKTEAHGHTRVLTASETVDAVTAFLRGPAA